MSKSILVPKCVQEIQDGLAWSPWAITVEDEHGTETVAWRCQNGPTSYECANGLDESARIWHFERGQWNEFTRTAAMIA